MVRCRNTNKRVNYLNVVLLHRQRSVHVVQLVVQAAGVAHRFADLVPPPQGRVGGVTVGALQANASRRAQSSALLLLGGAPSGQGIAVAIVLIEIPALICGHCGRTI